MPGARWGLGAALLAGGLGGYAATGVFSGRAPGDGGPAVEVVVFFCLLVAYIVPVFDFISERTAKALAALKPWLTASPATAQRWEARLARKTWAWRGWVALGGLAAGVAHNLLLYGTLRIAPLGGSGLMDTAFTLGMLLVWTVMMLALSALTYNAVLFARVARNVQVDPLHSQRLRPFADAAIYPTLVVLGALALFPLQLADDETSPMAFIPGVLATCLPLLAVAALPVWPIHGRMAAAKREALAAVEAELAALPRPDPARPETLERVAPLLAYRRELQAAQEWPFDLGSLARLVLYLVIVPLTWIGAALIEQVVEAAL